MVESDWLDHKSVAALGACLMDWRKVLPTSKLAGLVASGTVEICYGYCSEKSYKVP